MQITNITQTPNVTIAYTRTHVVQVSNEDCQIVLVKARREGVTLPTGEQLQEVVEAVMEDWASAPQV